MAKYIVDYGTADGRAGSSYQGEADSVSGILDQVKPYLDADPGFGVKRVTELVDRSEEIPDDLLPPKSAPRHLATDGGS